MTAIVDALYSTNRAVVARLDQAHSHAHGQASAYSVELSVYAHVQQVDVWRVLGLSKATTTVGLSSAEPGGQSHMLLSGNLLCDMATQHDLEVWQPLTLS